MGKKGKPGMVAEICLYGASSCGFGYLAMGPAALAGGKAVGGGKMFGNGEPSKMRSCTEAYWLGMSELLEAGLERGAMVSVFEPGGERVAKVKAGGVLPYYGELKWEAAPVLVLSMEEVLAAAESPAMPCEKPVA